MNNNDFKASARNKRGLHASKNPFLTHGTRGSRQNGSLEPREDPPSNNRISKQRMITKQSSSSNLKLSPGIETMFAFQDFTNKENGFRQEEKNLNRQIKPKKTYPNKHGLETYHYPSKTYYETSNPIGQKSPTILYRQKYASMKSDHDFIKNYNSGSSKNRIKCQIENCNREIAYLLEEEDFGCCSECASRLKTDGLRLKDINEVKVQTPQMEDLHRALSNTLRTLDQSKRNLMDHEKSFLASLQYQIHQHDSYYNSLCQVILKKKNQTLQLLESSVTQAQAEFQQIRTKIFEKRVQIEGLREQLIAKGPKINNMTEPERKAEISKYMVKLPLQENFTKLFVSTWKVCVGDVNQFAKDFEKYILPVVENPEASEKQEKMERATVIPNDEIDDCLNQLICDEELQWGEKPKPKKTYMQVNQMYFSFEKHNSIIYENAEEYVSSPGFKKA